MLARLGLVTPLAMSLLLAVPPSGGGAQEQSPQAPPDLARIDQYLETRLAENNLPGAALAIVEGDEILHLQGFGRADRSGRPVTGETPFILGSTTKAFTALAVMQLVDAGALELDAPVHSYLPWFRTADWEASATITVRQLLNHTSGIPVKAGRRLLTDRDTTAGALERHVRALQDVTLARPPGEEFEYSNANYSVLGLLIQEIWGASFESYMEEQVLGPLEMHSSFTSEPAAREAGLATGHRLWFNRAVAEPDMPFVRGLAPAGYLIASARDLAHALVMHLDEGRWAGRRVISRDALAELHRPAAQESVQWSYAMGWLVGSERREKMLWHNGGVANFYSFVALLPERELGVALVVNAFNVMESHALDAMAFGLVDLLAGREPRRTSPVAVLAVRWVYTVAFAFLGLQLIWIAISAIKRRPWRATVLAGRRGWLRELRRIGLPIALNLAWVLIVLVALPDGFQTPLPVMLLFAPDLMSVFLASAGIATLWAVVQVGLRVRRLRSLAGAEAAGAAGAAGAAEAAEHPGTSHPGTVQ